jgi:hypothetical protein
VAGNIPDPSGWLRCNRSPLIEMTNRFLFSLTHKANLHTRLNGVLPKYLFAWSKTLFDKSKARSKRFENSPFGLKQFKSLIFRFAKIYSQKTF